MTKVAVLWRVSGSEKHVDCVLYTGAARFLLRIERGEEKELFGTFDADSVTDVIRVSSAVRERLTKQGWSLVHAIGEESFAATVVR